MFPEHPEKVGAEKFRYLFRGIAPAAKFFFQQGVEVAAGYPGGEGEDTVKIGAQGDGVFSGKFYDVINMIRNYREMYGVLDNG
jgi:hypothetical protein